METIGDAKMNLTSAGKAMSASKPKRSPRKSHQGRSRRRRGHCPSSSSAVQLTMPQMHTGSDAARVLLALSDSLSRWSLAAKSCIRRDRMRQESLRDLGLATRSAKITYEPQPLTPEEIAYATASESTVRSLFGDTVADYAHAKFLRAVSTGDMRSFKIRIIALKARDALAASFSALTNGFAYGLEECIDRAERLAGCVPDPSPRRLSRKERKRMERRMALASPAKSTYKQMASEPKHMGNNGSAGPSNAGNIGECVLPDGSVQESLFRSDAEGKEYDDEERNSTTAQSPSDGCVSTPAHHGTVDTETEWDSVANVEENRSEAKKLTTGKSCGQVDGRSGVAPCSEKREVSISSAQDPASLDGAETDVVDGVCTETSAQPTVGVTVQPIFSQKGSENDRFINISTGQKNQFIDVNDAKSAISEDSYRTTSDIVEAMLSGKISEVDALLLASALDRCEDGECDAGCDDEDDREIDDDMDVEGEGGGCWRDDDSGWAPFYQNEIRGYSHDPDDVPDYY